MRERSCAPPTGEIEPATWEVESVAESETKEKGRI